MRREYDFSRSRRNPFSGGLKKQITIRLEEDTINYFKKLASQTGISYQNLINIYLSDCASNNRKLTFRWD